MPELIKFVTRAMLVLVAGFAAISSLAADDSGSSQPRLVPVKLRINKDESKLVYSIAVHFGSKVLEAVLDTGSMPTLLLKDRVPPRDAQPTGATYSVTYGGDRTYDSDVVQGPIRIGTASSTIAFGIVSAVHCVPPNSKCPTYGEGPRDARFAGLHPAIVGARITTDAGATLQPAFRELGVHRFVITAPRQHERDGTLQLDPNANETSGFVPIYPAPPAPGVLDGAEIAGVDFAVGADDPTKVTFAAPGSSTQAILFVGQLPYLGLSILTDLDNNAYAVSPRSTAPDGVIGHVP